MTDTPPPADDLVERLNEREGLFRQYAGTTLSRAADSNAALLRDAASEIARLRQKLEDAEAKIRLPGAAIDAASASLQERLTLAQSQRDALAKAAGPVLSILEAVRFTAGLGKTQMERVERLRAALGEGGK